MRRHTGSLRRQQDAPPRTVARFLGRIAAIGLASVLTTSVAAAPAAAAAAASAHHADPRYYVALGDSYAVGYQPSPVAGPTRGYTGVVAAATHLRLENFGCSGATTTSVLHTVGCAAPYGPPAATRAVAYPHQTQAAAAEAFVRRHRGHIGLVTVSVGGNDVTHCANASSPEACVLAALPQVRRNVETLASRLRAAAGRRVPLIGLTYPDVFLGLWVYPSGHTDHALASLSVTAFRSLFNPALADAYRGAGGQFLDITRDAGGYTPLTERATVARYGSVPVAVARVCRLTWFCRQGNIHATTAGYTLIGRRVVARYQAAVAR